jgi:copper chaperone
VDGPLGWKDGSVLTEQSYTVTGMSCSHCVNRVTNEVTGLQGVEDLSVDLETGRLTVRGDGFTDDDIRHAVQLAGYDVAG